MKYQYLLLLFVVLPLTAFDDADIFNNDEEINAEFLESIGEKPKEKEASAEEFILKSDDTVPNKIKLLSSIAQGHYNKERDDEMVRVMRRILEIKGITNVQKRDTMSRLGQMASNAGARVRGGKEVMRKASVKAYTEAFEYAVLAYNEAEKKDAKLDCAVAAIGLAANANTPKAIGKSIEIAEEMLARKDVAVEHKITIIDWVVRNCTESGAYGHHEHKAIKFMEMKLELVKHPVAKGKIYYGMANLQYFTMNDLPAARKTLKKALALIPKDISIYEELVLFRDYLSDTD